MNKLNGNANYENIKIVENKSHANVKSETQDSSKKEHDGVTITDAESLHSKIAISNVSNVSILARFFWKRKVMWVLRNTRANKQSITRLPLYVTSNETMSDLTDERSEIYDFVYLPIDFW